MTHETRLIEILRRIGPSSVAVSGGVDSMTLAHLAHQALGADARMIHAVSAAAPAAATARVKAHAARHGWRLDLIDAGELNDPRYRANPANRCFFCKTNLYGSMAALACGQLLSGTNLDDLGDWRPGLKAAEDHGVRHPFVEAGIDKAGVRAIAAARGLDDLAELPAAPCLASRIETGLRVEPETLIAIDRAETALRARLAPETLRCRVRAGGVAVELDAATLERLSEAERAEALALLAEHFPCAEAALEPYRRGSAFLR